MCGLVITARISCYEKTGATISLVTHMNAKDLDVFI